MKSVFAGVSAVALAVAGAASIASALGNEQANNAPTASNQAQQPVYRCESLGIDHIASDSYKFSVKYAAYNGATYKSTVYRVYDANGKEVYNTAGAKFNGFEPGNYTAKAFVTVSVNGKDETVTSDGCTKTFTIKAAQNDQNNKPDKPSEPTPQPQEPSNPNQNKPDDQKPTPQQPSKPDNQNKPNNPTPQQPSTPAKPTEPSKPTTPTQPSQLDTKPNTPNTPSKPAAPANPAPTNQQSSPTDAANSNATPAATTTQTNTANSPSNDASAPNQLPKTGISELAGLAGTGSLGYALYAYIVSRKNR
jgi:Gram-positive signal peptide protein, YSIRK family